MMRVLFAGNPAIAVPSLHALREMELAGTSTGGAGLELAGVLTNPNGPRGPGKASIPTEVSFAASALSREEGLPPIPQLKCGTLDAGAREQVRALKPDLLVSFAYGRLFGPRFMELFPLGGINVHPSLLPKYRGPSPLHAAILAGDRETGVSIQRIVQEMDGGDILAAETFPLAPRETTASLSKKAARTGAALIRGLLEEMCRGDARAVLAGGKPQTGEATYSGIIKKEDGKIDWRKSALVLDAQIRAYTPWPLSFCLSRGETLSILEAEALPGEGGAPLEPGRVLGIDRQKGILVGTGEGVLAVSRLQYSTKKALDWKSFLNGARGFIGSLLE